MSMTADAPASRGQLRLLATSDVHGHIVGHDELRNRPLPGRGLARLATRIREERASASGLSLLLDNGDMLQGTPFAATAAAMPMDAAHPLVRVMEHLGYDAMGLGNHDFDFGTDYLWAFARAVGFPVLCSNLDNDGALPILGRSVLDRQLVCSDGRTRDVRIGLCSVLPELTSVWARDRIAGQASFSNPVAAAAEAARALRADGADLVILLCHSGLIIDSSDVNDENFLLALTENAGIDAIIGGHTHLSFPGEQHGQINGADTERGTINGTPVVMPGFAAGELGRIDLELHCAPEGGWTVASARTSLVPSAEAPEDPDIREAAQPSMQASMTRLARVVGHAKTPVHSYFSLLKPDPSLSAIGGAILTALDDFPGFDDLPRLASVSSVLTGGRQGPNHYVNIPAGPIETRAVEMLFPFEDTICALCLSGVELLEWLERSASIFTHLDADSPPPLLVNKTYPGFNFDVVCGLEVEIDPTQPARYDGFGTLADGGSRRVTRVRFDGEDLDPNARFLVGMSSYRASGGGRFPGAGPGRIVQQSALTMRGAIADYLRAHPLHKDEAPRWGLKAKIGRTVVLETSQNARSHLDEIAEYEPEILTDSPDGFLRLRLAL